MAMCYAKYGSARCMQWLELCKITPDRWLTLSSADRACMKKRNCLI
ncbi:unnamed protein product [Anisakis simplex]|uniref:Uncharacterized protein n=1 Tax=Anisakis simplex TaxID=6269 RepID=A0A3P6PSZ1_ANISI|nr:unnamed protein product [Anisakis simplex]